MEKAVGCIIICALFFISLIDISNRFAKLLKLESCREGCENLQTYTLSIVVFTALATCFLMILVHKSTSLPQSSIFTSGLFFTIATVITGLFTQLIYWLLSKPLKLYPLEEEIKWTFLLLCLGMSLLCYTQHLNLHSFVFLSLALTKVTWLDFCKPVLSAELDSLKKLPSTYLYSLAFIITSIFASIRYDNDIILFGCSIIGIFLGILAILIYNAYVTKHN